MKAIVDASRRWTLADLIDFEALAARASDDGARHERTVFSRDIRPELSGRDAVADRRLGLRLWLDIRRQGAEVRPGALWSGMVFLLRCVLLLAMALAGAGLAIGLCLGNGQQVHVVVFVAITLLLPWSLWALLLVLSAVGRLKRGNTRRGVDQVLRLAVRFQRDATRARWQEWSQRLTDTVFARRAFAAELASVLQWGGLGFQLGLALAFAATLMVFDVRFYWEATLQSNTLIRVISSVMAAPWSWAWPAAVPTDQVIAASRIRYLAAADGLPGAALAASWWRFLLMALLVWGVLPRILLIMGFGLMRRRALARLDFQAPRHRALWRELTRVERGTVAVADADSALVLNVGGFGLSGDDIRGYLLRRLRVNPLETAAVSVLDDEAEAQADRALASAPKHVVVLAEDWSLSPRQMTRVHKRVRGAVGAATPVTWVIVGQRQARARIAAAMSWPTTSRSAIWATIQ